MTTPNPKILDVRKDAGWLFVGVAIGVAATVVLASWAALTPTPEEMRTRYALLAAAVTMVLQFRLIVYLFVINDALAVTQAARGPRRPARPDVVVRGRAGRTGLVPATVEVLWIGPPPTADTVVRLDSLTDAEFWLEVIVPGCLAARKSGS